VINPSTPNNSIKLIECPRDAMQGWQHFIPTQQKIDYLNALLKVGFDTIDFGSFVSPKAIPQMADTHEVIKHLQTGGTASKLLAIVANIRGAEEALQYDAISYVGFPFSISPTFQQRNTNKTIEQSLREVLAIQKLCVAQHRQLVIYISMGFGNPYGDEYNKDIVISWVKQLAQTGVQIISLADTVGVAHPGDIRYLFSHLLPSFPEIKFGAHFHSTPFAWEEKITAAFEAGCCRFDSALKGIGGCPMAEDELVGNIATENMVRFCEQKNATLSLDFKELAIAQKMADKIFI
jgi:hydroxymethylglutaryl-CoA lyase